MSQRWSSERMIAMFGAVVVAGRAAEAGAARVGRVAVCVSATIVARLATMAATRNAGRRPFLVDPVIMFIPSEPPDPRSV